MLLQHLSVFIFSVYLFHCTDAVITQDLGGKWKLKDVNDTYSVDATVPGGVYTDLMNAGVIEDVFYGINDQETRWVSKTNWIYSKTFTVDHSILLQQNINLVLDGIDTFATLYLNDVQIGETENMFVRYIFDVKDVIKEGTNNITVLFESAVVKAQELYEEQAASYIVPPTCVDSAYHGECHANHVRKMQASFAWDWGPALPSMGIWKSIYLESFNSSAIRDVTVNITLNDDTDEWLVTVQMYLSGNSQYDYLDGWFDIRLQTIITTYAIMILGNATLSENGEYVQTANLTIPKDAVNLWWPNGYGNAYLYPLTVNYTNYDKTETTSRILKIGFRTIELVQNSLGENGTTFYFKINSIPIFMKGSNAIPINILPELGQNETQIRYLLESAREVHMNMLRVWGGGVYESDTYYDIADELGILIWQDYMFACSMYPTSEKFLENVRKEVRHQTRRLQHHASIVIWAGNNENEAALRDSWYGTSSNFSLYQSDYVKLYVGVVKDESQKNDQSRPFLTSSPTNGIESEKEDYVASNPASRIYGDVHYYNYILDSWSAQIYPRARFVSEYGYQSLPTLQSWYSAIDDRKELNISSYFMESRQHHPGGYVEIELLISERLTLPSVSEDSFIDAYIFYSQVIQAMAYKIETENYRRMRSILFDNGEGLTMGALYWQLNDVWVAPTWAGIDFQNRWKMAHYFAKDFFAPVIVTSYLENGNLDIYVVSDLVTSIFNATVTIQVYKWSSFEPVAEETLTVDVEGGMSKNIKSLSVEEYLPEEACGSGSYSILNCFLYFTISNESSELGPNNYVFPAVLKKANISTPQIKITSVTKLADENTFEIVLTTDRISLFIWLETGDILGRFSENGFLQVTPTKTLYFYPEATVTLDQLKDSLTVTNLLNEKYS